MIGAARLCTSLIHVQDDCLDCVPDNAVGAAGGTAIADALTRNSTLNKLFMSRTWAGVGLATVSWTLLDMTTVCVRVCVCVCVCVPLSDNAVGADGTIQFAAMLMVNSTLKHLDLWGTPFGRGWRHGSGEVKREGVTLSLVARSCAAVSAVWSALPLPLRPQQTTFKWEVPSHSAKRCHTTAHCWRWMCVVRAPLNDSLCRACYHRYSPSFPP